MNLTNEKRRTNKGMSLLTFPDSYVIIDIETTGLDPVYDEIIEITALKVSQDKIIDTFSTLIKPINPIDAFITELTGITNEMVANAPTITDVLPKFLVFTNHEILIGHNINFDINFLYDNLIKAGYEKGLSNNFVDTLRLGRRILKNLKHHRLKDLATYYNIDTTGAHRSTKDCEITYQVYLHLKKEVQKEYGSLEHFLHQNQPKAFTLSSLTTTKTEFNTDNPLYNKYIAITGTLTKFTRKEAMQIILDLGGHCENAVTERTNYLILGNNDYNPILRGKKSSKLKKAEQLKLAGYDIEILSENLFYEFINYS